MHSTHQINGVQKITGRIRRNGVGVHLIGQRRTRHGARGDVEFGPYGLKSSTATRFAAVGEGACIEHFVDRGRSPGGIATGREQSSLAVIPNDIRHKFTVLSSLVIGGDSESHTSLVDVISVDW